MRRTQLMGAGETTTTRGRRVIETIVVTGLHFLDRLLFVSASASLLSHPASAVSVGVGLAAWSRASAVDGAAATARAIEADARRRLGAEGAAWSGVRPHESGVRKQRREETNWGESDRGLLRSQHDATGSALHRRMWSITGTRCSRIKADTVLPATQCAWHHGVTTPTTAQCTCTTLAASALFHFRSPVADSYRCVVRVCVSVCVCWRSARSLLALASCRLRRLAGWSKAAPRRTTEAR